VTDTAKPAEPQTPAQTPASSPSQPQQQQERPPPTAVPNAGVVRHDHDDVRGEPNA